MSSEGSSRFRTEKVGSPYRGQIVFLDTPGVHEPHDQLGKEMLHGARHSLDDADVLFWMVYPKSRTRKNGCLVG